MAARLRLDVFIVSNGSCPIRPPGTPNVSMVLVGDSADAADDWIFEHISAVDVCVTSDIPLASRCLKGEARVVSPAGKHWTEANIGNALAGREIARHLRELGTNTRGPARGAWGDPKHRGAIRPKPMCGAARGQAITPPSGSNLPMQKRIAAPSATPE